MTEGYRAGDYCPFLVRYKLRTMPWPLRLSNLYERTPIRQLAMSRTSNNTNTEAEVEAEPEVKAEVEAEPEVKAEASNEAKSDHPY